jgi:hypothetical protein
VQQHIALSEIAAFRAKKRTRPVVKRILAARGKIASKQFASFVETVRNHRAPNVAVRPAAAKRARLRQQLALGCSFDVSLRQQIGTRRLAEQVFIRRTDKV